MKFDAWKEIQVFTNHQQVAAIFHSITGDRDFAEGCNKQLDGVGVSTNWNT
ncbi:hypothetical protein C5167_008458, partial [Papaver somniferum]